jgi:hypothetical protein
MSFIRKIKTQIEKIYENIRDGMKNDKSSTRFWKDTVAPSIIVEYPTSESYFAVITALEVKTLQLRIQCLTVLEQQELQIVNNKPKTNSKAFKELPAELQQEIKIARSKLTEHSRYVRKLVHERLPRYCYPDFQHTKASDQVDLDPILTALSAEDAIRQEIARKRLDVTDCQVATLALQRITRGHIHDAGKLTSKEQQDFEAIVGGINGNLRGGEVHPVFDMVVNKGVHICSHTPLYHV